MMYANEQYMVVETDGTPDKEFCTQLAEEKEMICTPMTIKRAEPNTPKSTFLG